MGQIKTYSTLSATSLEDLDEVVNESIEEGYQPYGDQYFDGYDFIQVMVSNKK